MGAMNGKQIRFAPLVRVSTEKQEKQGESLLTQRKSLQRDIERLGGKVVDWYGGQEHATPGYERAEVDRLIADAVKGRFDAVIVAYADRWSRDNIKSKEGLDVFRAHGICFFVGITELDLFNPEHRFILGMNAEVGEFIALQQRKKSIENKIERAKQGKPVCGPHMWPFGRRWDKDSATWSIIPEDKAMIEDIAKRFLNGTSLPKLSKEYNISHTNLIKILRQRCGATWDQTFTARNLNIHEVVTVKVPRLLDDKTIKEICQRIDACRTYLHPAPLVKYDYLLSSYVFCAECGYSMSGQANSRNHRRYYRHTHATPKPRLRQCPIHPSPHVRADWLEEEVVIQLFNLLGSPAHIERAIRSAVPECDKLMKRRQVLEVDLSKLVKGRERILSLVVKDVLTDEQAESQLSALNQRESILRAEMDKLTAQLESIPDEEAIRCYVEKIGSTIFVYDDNLNEHPGGNDLGTFLQMTYADKRRLVETVFSKPLADGKPAGVYVSLDPTPGRGRSRNWRFSIKGQLEFEKVISTNKHKSSREQFAPR